ncbi:MAG: hypothetical protein RBJ76_12075 [Stenomitos frigidus ULC029]
MTLCVIRFSATILNIAVQIQCDRPLNRMLYLPVHIRSRLLERSLCRRRSL